MSYELELFDSQIAVIYIKNALYISPKELKSHQCQLGIKQHLFPPPRKCREKFLAFVGAGVTTKKQGSRKRNYFTQLPPPPGL
jgi:hypothetical protein